MKMSTFKELAKNETLSKDYQDIYKIISETYNEETIGVKDSEKSHKLSEIEEIKQRQYDIVKSNYAEGGYQVLDDVQKESVVKVSTLINQMKGVRDSAGFYNDVTGIGTGIDPSYYSNVNIPISISPYEASALYSNGGIAKVIIDKKSKGVLLNDFEFEGLEPEDAKQLKDYALKKGFERAIPLRDALVFGGSVLYPRFKRDNPLSYSMPLDELIKNKILDKDCIDYWTQIDRWNCVHVPNYNITAKDYLQPDFIYVPLGAQKVNTQRASMLKPYALPYWAAIQQLGWSTSDFIGYLKAIYDYEIMLASLPVMFQQMSIMFANINLDATMVMNGTDAIEDIVKKNQERLRKASLLKPEIFNAASLAGDIKIIDRHFQGFEEIIHAMTQAICAKASLAESIIFHIPATGQNATNESDIILKQSETIKMIGNDIAPQLRNSCKILTISCFGADSDQAQREVNIKFGAPLVSTDTEKADNGLKLSQFISACQQATIPMDVTMKLAKQFYTYDLEKIDMDRLTNVPESQEGEGNPLDISNGLQGILNR